MIRDADPTRLSSINRAFRGDVETIVGKALEKDKSRRYQSAQALAADVRRFLAHEPLVARPASAMYQLRKFARRNRALVGGIGFGCVAIVVGLVVSIHQAIVATHARDAAEQRERMRLSQTYRASIAAAASALENHDVALARRSLAMAPESLREWEWSHLSSRLDECLRIIAAPDARPDAAPWFVDAGGDSAVLLPTAKGLVMWNAVTGERLNARGGSNTLYAQDHRGTACVILNQDQIEARRPFGTWTGSASALGLAADTITRMAVSEGGRFIAFISPQSIARLDLQSNELTTTEIDNEGTGVDQLALTPSGDIVLVSAVAGRPAVWTESAGLTPMDDVPAFARSVDVSPDGRYVILGLQDTTIGLWRLSDRSLVALGRGHSHAVTGVAFSPDGQRIASVSLDRTVRLWEAATLTPFATLHGHDRGIWGVTFSQDGSRIATTSEDRTIRIWDARRQWGRNVLLGHEGFVYGLAFSDDAGRLASAGWDQTIRTWNLSTVEQIDVLTVDANVVTALAFSSDGRYLVWIGGSGFGAWDLESMVQITPDASAPIPPSSSVRCIDLIADTTFVALPWTLNEHGVVVWNVSSNTVEQWPVDDLRGRRARFLGAGGRYAVGVKPDALSTDVRMARRDSGSELTILDLDRAEWLPLPKFTGPFALSPRAQTGARMAARRADDLTRVEVWDLDRRRLDGRLLGHTDSVYAIAYSPDAKRIATGGRDSLRLWDAATFTEIVRLRGHTSFIWSLAFSPDGRQLASGSGDNTVRLWDTSHEHSRPIE